MARDLVSEGYRAEAIPASLHDVYIIRPDGKRYKVNPIDGTCNCAAGLSGKRCSHVQQAYAIARETWCRGGDDSNTHAWQMFDLGCWMDDVAQDFQRGMKRAA